MKQKIFFSVMAVHLLLLFLAAVHHQWAPSRITRKTIAVHQMQSRDLPNRSVLAEKKGAASSGKKGQKGGVGKGKTPPVRLLSPTKGTIRPNQGKRALQNREEKERLLPLGDEGAPSFVSEVKIPDLIPLTRESVRFQVETTEGTCPASYGEILIQALQQQLQLPEIGVVCIRLTVNAEGTIRSVQLLDTKSKKNGAFLQEALPKLLLPEFRRFGILEPVLEFTITFRNVEDF